MVIMSDGRPMTATAFVKRGGGGRVRRWRGDPLANLYEILGGREGATVRLWLVATTTALLNGHLGQSS